MEFGILSRRGCDFGRLLYAVRGRAEEATGVDGVTREAGT